MLMFPDSAEIFVKAGNGGDGCVSFRRERFEPRGGPDGGAGGRGGNVILQAEQRLETLIDFRNRRHFKAERGKPGKGQCKNGKNGGDIVIKVPVGTMVVDALTGNVLADLVEDAGRVLVAEGGRGGRGNVSMKSSVNRAPRTCEEGGRGSERTLSLELRIIADAGLIGCPNAGKSTLISRLCKAKPKIADYPFTTLQPVPGVVYYREFKKFRIVEIPGLIKDSHLGKGLGDRFLRHIRRTKVLIHVVDLSRNPYENYMMLNEEIKLYAPELLEKPQVIAGNKIDLPEGKNNLKGFVSKLGGKCVYGVSGLKGTGLEKIVNAVSGLVESS